LLMVSLSTSFATWAMIASCCCRRFGGAEGSLTLFHGRIQCRGCPLARLSPAGTNIEGPCRVSEALPAPAHSFSWQSPLAGSR
jgi:hypothetical protein